MTSHGFHITGEIDDAKHQQFHSLMICRNNVTNNQNTNIDMRQIFDDNMN